MTSTKKILAHYAIYQGKVYYLSIITYTSSKVISIIPFTTETANTEFFDGITIIGNSEITKWESELIDIAQKNDINLLVTFINAQSLDYVSGTPYILHI